MKTKFYETMQQRYIKQKIRTNLQKFQFEYILPDCFQIHGSGTVPSMLADHDPLCQGTSDWLRFSTEIIVYLLA